MYIDPILLLIIYAFSMVSILVSLYALWSVFEVQEELRKQRATNKRLKSVTSQVKTARPTWPPR
jgi:hypothetical protein